MMYYVRKRQNRSVTCAVPAVQTRSDKADHSQQLGRTRKTSSCIIVNRFLRVVRELYLNCYTWF